MSDSIIEKPAGAREAAKAPLIVCTMLTTNPSWRWFAPWFQQTRWEFFGGNPRNWMERRITRPALASWRGCWEAIRTARRERAALLVSHDARVTFRTAQSARIQSVHTPHLAWGFNFTTLPRGRHRRLMASAFKKVDRFITYSSMERSVYADYFGIDPARIEVVLWGVRPPVVDPPTHRSSRATTSVRSAETLAIIVPCSPPWPRFRRSPLWRFSARKTWPG